MACTVEASNVRDDGEIGSPIEIIMTAPERSALKYGGAGLRRRHSVVRAAQQRLESAVDGFGRV